MAMARFSASSSDRESLNPTIAVAVGKKSEVSSPEDFSGLQLTSEVEAESSEKV